MEIRVLRYFLEVAREESMTKAAAYLHVSQPTLSRQLKDLERELGKKLFVRTNYSIKLTDEGMLLRRRAEDILEMVDKTAAEFKSLDEITGGDIHIGCAESEGITYFIDTVKALHNRYPNVRCHIHSSETETATERLDKGLLDFAIIVQTVDLSRYNYLTIPYKDRWGLIMRKDHPLAQKDRITLPDVLNEPLICSRQGLREEHLAWFGESQSKLNIIATYDMLFNAALMAREGFGCVLGFDDIASTSADSELCFRPLSPTLESPMHIIWKKYQVFTPAAKLLLQEMQQRFSAEK